MKVLLRCLPLLIFVAAGAVAEPQTITGRELAERLRATSEGSSFIRMRMEVKQAGVTKETLQIQIKQRDPGGNRNVAYQILWPKERKGEGVLLRKTAAGSLSGAAFSPVNGIRTLGSGDGTTLLFGSDLTYEDVADDVFAWEHQSIVGEETVDKTVCLVLESRPGRESSYSRVRSWIDARRLVPLRVEKFGPGGQVVVRIETTKVFTDDTRRVVPANLRIQRAGSGTITEVDGSKLRRGIKYEDREFTPEGLAELKAPKAE
jgi:hypothetical protein